MERCDGIPIDRVAFSKQLQQLAEKWGDETALVDVSRDGSERALSRRELFEAIEKVACHLNDRNVQQGDYVVIALPNGYENVVATLAAWQLGACCVFMSPKGTDEERIAESVINEINGVDMDCVLSVLPAQKEASFITGSRALLDARLWIGGGSFLLQKSEKPKASGKVRQFLLKRIFRYRVEKQNQESKND